MENKNSKLYRISVAICAIVLTVIAGFLIIRAGNLDPTVAPGDTMKTLDDIYAVMTIDTATTSYGIDSPASPTSTMYTLQQIYDIAVKRRLRDTNQNKCYNDTVESACPVTNFPGQDAEYTSANSFTCDMSFTTTTDYTVIDNCTGLMWKQCSYGQSDDADCSGAAATTTWTLALQQCDGLTFAGKSDWRLPNIKELQSIVDYATSSPAINRTYFPATVSNFYWSSTSYVDTPSFAWRVLFYSGYVGDDDKTGSVYVRCVRGS